VKQGASATVYRTAITADLQYDANDRRLVAHSNPVGGNIQIVGNRGGVDVSANRVDGNLQCEENSPAPTGGANVVRGSAEDQCARLTGGTASPAPGGTSRFSDTAGSVHEVNIEKVAAAGIALGGHDGRFRPNAPVTRGQMATFIQRAYRLPAGTTGVAAGRSGARRADLASVGAPSRWSLALRTCSVTVGHDLGLLDPTRRRPPCCHAHGP
jgi:hypothetical protein